MLDFRLQVFYTVAKRLNFTKAAAELYITQPAVTKHIRELERHFNSPLFERSGNKKIMLTPAGVTLLQYAEKISELYRELEFDMNLLANKHAGILRLGASTTVSQYVIAPILAQFRQKFKDIQVSLVTGNTEQIEQALLNKEIDLGIIEGLSKNPQISYSAFINDELVLVAGTNSKIKKESIKPEELKNYPLLMREHGSGTLDVIAHALKPLSIKLSDLNIEMHLGSTESIKSYLLHSNCIAFLSVHAILKEIKANEFRIIDVKGLEILRPFYFIQPHGQPPPLPELFARFASSHKN
jgi:DNA-binding transcriptional LysR family regulator